MGFHVVEEHVRWEDIDAAGIINYQAYLRFFALAEAEMFRSCGLSYQALSEELGIWLPRVRVECDFYHPVTLDELLLVKSCFGGMGRSSVQVKFEVHPKQRPELLTATGKYVLVSVRRHDFVKVPLPELFRQRIAPFVEPGAPPATAR